MIFSSVDDLYWVAGLVGHITLLFILYWRRRTKRFPVFTSLITFNLCRSIVLRLVHTYAPHWHFYVYWLLYVADITLQLLLIYEIAGIVFRPLGVWATDVRKKAILWTLVSVVIAILLTLLPKSPVDAWYQTWILKSSFFTSALECELLAGIAMMSWEGGFPWNSHVARITIGFVIFAFPDMLVEIATTRFGLKSTDTIYQNLIHCRMTAYLVSLIYWSVSLWMKGDEPQILSEPMAEQVQSLSVSLASKIRSLPSEGRPR